MKTKLWLLSGLMVSCLVTRQVEAADIAVVKGDSVNVRGQPSIFSEVITQIKKGETVIVLEEITVKKPKADEPSRWARIQMPTNTPVWVHASFIDTNNSVKPPRLNIRAGAGENYSVIGQLQRGNVVKTIRLNEDWMEIEANTNVFAFVAADLITKPTAAPVVPVVEKTEPVKPAEPSPTVTTVPPPAGITNAPIVEAPLLVADNLKPEPKTAPAKEPIPAIPVESKAPPAEIKAPMTEPKTPPVETNTLTTVTTAPITETNVAPKIEPVETKTTPTAPMAANENKTAPVAAQPVPLDKIVAQAEKKPAAGYTVLRPPSQQTTTPRVPRPQPVKIDESLPKRTVQREGIVRGTTSIQAPTYFELVSPQTGKVLNYLSATSTNLVLKNYKGKKVTVTGQELMDVRWQSTPLLEVEDLQLAPDATK